MAHGFKKAGGGRLNGDGVFTDYEWADKHPADEGDGQSKSGFQSLFFVIRGRMDGATEDDEQALWAGNAELFDISDDGKVITPTSDDNALNEGSPFHAFFESLLEAGFPEALLTDEYRDLRAALGSRVQFTQVQEIDRRTNKPRTRIAKQGKFKGKEFPVTSTQIGKVYDLPGKPAVKGASKAKAPAAAADNTDVADVATEVLKVILEASGGTAAKAKLSVAVLQKMLKHARKDLKEEVRAWLADDDNLSGIEGVSYNAKKAILTLDE